MELMCNQEELKVKVYWSGNWRCNTG